MTTEHAKIGSTSGATTAAVTCPACGQLASERVEEVRRVLDPATGRYLGWARLVAVFRHGDAEHVLFAGRLFFPEHVASTGRVVYPAR
jgi:hypothetical protein